MMKFKKYFSSPQLLFLLLRSFLIMLLTISCTSYRTCNDFCKSKDFPSGKCDIQPLKNNICGNNKIYLGAAEDCKPDTGIIGIEKGCCCTPKK
ncbi:MAG: hypothetical protein QXG00_01040 [Candidatus Woesearchaeota archaeon]